MRSDQSAAARSPCYGIPARAVMALGVTLILGGCVTMGHGDIRELKVDRADFHGYLAREYQALSTMEQDAGHEQTSGHFAAKAFAAARGEEVQPDPVDPDTIPPDLSPELDRAAVALFEALELMRDSGSDHALAVAQASFDCWVAQSGQARDMLSVIATLPCRDQFIAAMQTMSPGDAAATTRSVYFDPNSTVLDDQSQIVLADLAQMLRQRPHWKLELIGSVDRTGRKLKNPSLAMRRAIAVRNALAQMGIAPDRMDVENEEHSDTMLGDSDTETGDDSDSRRVDIIAMPSFSFEG